MLEDAVIYTVPTSKDPRGTRRVGPGVGDKAFGIARTNSNRGQRTGIIKHTHGHAGTRPVHTTLGDTTTRTH